MDKKNKTIIIATVVACILIVGAIFLFTNKNNTGTKDKNQANTTNKNDSNADTDTNGSKNDNNTSTDSGTTVGADRKDELKSETAEKGLRDSLDVAKAFFASIYTEDLDAFKSNVSGTVLNNIITHYNTNLKGENEKLSDDEILKKGLAEANKYFKEKLGDDWNSEIKLETYSEQETIKPVEAVFANGQKLFFSVENLVKDEQSLISTAMGFTNYIYEMDLWFSLSNMS